MKNKSCDRSRFQNEIAKLQKQIPAKGLWSTSLTVEIEDAKWEINLAINDCMQMNLIDFMHAYVCMWAVEIKQFS